MRELQLSRERKSIPSPRARRRRAPLANAVERKDRRLVKWTRKERTGRVTLVMIDKRQRRAHLLAERVTDHRRQPRLVLEPHRHGHRKTAEACRRKREIRLEQPLELLQRLFIEDDVVEIR